MRVLIRAVAWIGLIVLGLVLAYYELRFIWTVWGWFGVLVSGALLPVAAGAGPLLAWWITGTFPVVWAILDAGYLLCALALGVTGKED